MSVFTLVLLNNNGNLEYSWEKDGSPSLSPATASTTDKLTFEYKTENQTENTDLGISNVELIGHTTVVSHQNMQAEGLFVYAYNEFALSNEGTFSFTATVDNLSVGDPQMIVEGSDPNTEEAKKRGNHPKKTVPGQ